MMSELWLFPFHPVPNFGTLPTPLPGASASLGAPRKLGPVSRQGMLENDAFDEVALKEKMSLQDCGKWMCHLCPRYLAATRLEAMRHARACGQRPKLPKVSSSVAKFACSAASCGKKFALITALHEHYRTAHPDRCRARRCMDCWKLFADEVMLKAHRKEVHWQNKSATFFNCPYCDYTSLRKYNLERIHLPQMHPALITLDLVEDQEVEIALKPAEDVIAENDEGDRRPEDQVDSYSVQQDEVYIPDPMVTLMETRIRCLKSRHKGQ